MFSLLDLPIEILLDIIDIIVPEDGLYDLALCNKLTYSLCKDLCDDALEFQQDYREKYEEVEIEGFWITRYQAPSNFLAKAGSQKSWKLFTDTLTYPRPAAHVKRVKFKS